MFFDIGVWKLWESVQGPSCRFHVSVVAGAEDVHGFASGDRGDFWCLILGGPGLLASRVISAPIITTLIVALITGSPT